jgi:hypothetical protein
MNINITNTKGIPRFIKVNPLGLIGDKKRELGEPNAMWKFDGEVLRDDRTFQSYEMQNGDAIITNSEHVGGINDILNIYIKKLL